MAPSHAPNLHITIRAPTPQTLPALKRLNALLLPINYPESFYSEILSSPTTARLTRLAFWFHSPLPTPRINGDAKVLDGELDGEVERERGWSPREEEQGICVGGVRCRLEPPYEAGTSPGPSESPQLLPRGGSIYIMTLCTLSPYRHLGVGTQLITSILSAAVELGCSEVYAHVWEANTDALDWYRKRGFDVDSGEVVQGYYRKLRPAGARVVRRRVGIDDALVAAGRGFG